MKIPPGYTEAQVLEALEHVVVRLAPKYVFGPHSLEDIKQEARMFALQALEKEGGFNPERGSLVQFFWTVCSSRLSNMKRDQMRRTDSPCRRCFSGHFCGEDGRPCPKFAAWRKRGEGKIKLMNASALHDVDEEKESRTRTESAVEAEAETRELLRLIDQKLPAHLRSDWLRMRSGVRLRTEKREAVERAVWAILGPAA
jgi:hypothetical protein